MARRPGNWTARFFLAIVPSPFLPVAALHPSRDRSSFGVFAPFDRAPAVFLLFIGAAFALYHAALGFGFLGYDDGYFVRDAPMLRRGLSWETIRWAFEANFVVGEQRAEYWMPLTLLSRLLDHALFGLDGGWHHFQNILFHGVNTALITLIARKLFERRSLAFAIGAIYLIHPLNVEVVCWIALRKDVLAATFSFLTLLLYLRFCRKPSLSTYLTTLGSFCLALMAKPSVVALPAAFLLLDYWPLNRLPGSSNTDWREQARILVVRGAEKLPFVLLALGVTLLTYVGLDQMNRLGGARYEYTFPDRLAATLIGYGDYVLKFLAPDQLCALYSLRNPADLTFSLVAKGTLICLSCTIGSVILAWRGYRFVLFGWLWFLVLLLPVTGLVSFGRQSIADRYMYVPMLGLLVASVGTLDGLARFILKHTTGWANWTTRTVGVSAIAVAFLALATKRTTQMATWANDFTLWEHVFSLETDSIVAFNNYAAALGETGAISAAEMYFRAALKVHPESYEEISHMGTFLARNGRSKRAIPYLETAVRLNPFEMVNHTWLVRALQDDGRPREARFYAARQHAIRGRAFLREGLKMLQASELDLAHEQFSLAYSALLRLRSNLDGGASLLPEADWVPFTERELDRFAAKNPRDESLFFIRGYLLLLRSETGPAEHEFSALSARNPQTAEPRWRQALCLAEAGEVVKAQQVADSAAACAVAFPDGYADWQFHLKSLAPNRPAE